MFLNAKLETERLIIRPYQIDDIDQTYAVVSEKDFYQYIPEDIPD
ncbi:GNAT family N-acetyltransferase [Ureibacillus manganicus]|nr:GNAT family N-acetyltransferase [Ureibacillus manganicus]